MKSIYFFCIFFLFSITFLSGQTLHALLVADLNDKKIGKSCEIDQNMMLTELTTIANSINYTPKIKIISRGTFNFDEVKKAVESMSTNKNDIIFFYYSGHGYNDENKNDNFPHLNLKNGSYPLYEIHSQLKAKGSRLLITLGDCCNLILDEPLFDTKAFSTVDVENNKTSMYKNLFLEPEGDILISSSQKGQFSYSSPTEGGIYTNEFISGLHCAINYSKNLSWNKLLLDTKNRINRFNFVKGKQIPQYTINLNVLKNDIEENVNDPLISFVDINTYFTQLIDQSIELDVRYKLIDENNKYFIPKARVEVFDNTQKIRTQLIPIEDLVEKIYLNAGKINIINLIESRSEYDTNSEKYTKIAVQWVWNFKK